MTHLLDNLAFNQTIIFVNRVDRAKKLTELLKQKLFNPICIHSNLKQEERIKNYDLFKANGSRLLVATDLFGRGIDIERVNLVINYGNYHFYLDFPVDRDSYLHRVGRAGRFGTKGLAINFIKPDEEDNGENLTDKQVLMEVQSGFKIKIEDLPKELDTSLYMWLKKPIQIPQSSINLFHNKFILYTWFIDRFYLIGLCLSISI